MASRRLLKAEVLNDATVVRLAPGAFNEFPAWAIHEELSALALKLVEPRLHLDLGNVPLLTAAGLGMLVAVQKDLQTSGVRLTLTEVRPRLYDVFRATRLTEVFDIRTASPGTILVVEDDALTREALREALEGGGYGVACAADGRQALERLGQADLPALILLDLMMSGMDGWQFRREQGVVPSLASIPVVVVTAASDALAAATALGAADYLQKPVEFDHLLETVRQYC